MPMNARSFALMCAALAVSACTTMGTGTGELGPEHEPVRFAWKSTDGGTSGTLTATLPGGKLFSGPYLQFTREARSVDFDPVLDDYDLGWGNPDAGAPYMEDVFTTTYSDKVTAQLQAADGQRMSCDFHLNHPIEGMGGGGLGECELDAGGWIDAVLARD